MALRIMTTDFVTLFHQFVTTVTVNATLNVLIVKIINGIWPAMAINGV